MEDVPYITGLDQFLKHPLTDKGLDYLKDMGAACAAIGAVGLFHVENITPEAIDQGINLLTSDHRSLIINEWNLQKLMDSYTTPGRIQEGIPQKCLIGCPHLSLRQLEEWSNRILGSLHQADKSWVKVPTILFAAPQVIHEFRQQFDTTQLEKAGVKLSAACAEAYMSNELCSLELTVTNSSKLRAFTPAKMLLKDDLLRVIVTGKNKGD
jgi:predicted aconitase